jgi:hypothetical protein
MSFEIDMQVICVFFLAYFLKKYLISVNQS